MAVFVPRFKFSASYEDVRVHPLLFGFEEGHDRIERRRGREVGWRTAHVLGRCTTGLRARESDAGSARMRDVSLTRSPPVLAQSLKRHHAPHMWNNHHNPHVKGMHQHFAASAFCAARAV